MRRRRRDDVGELGVLAAAGRDRRPPRGLEAGPGLGIDHVGETGELVRQGAHVAAALDVVLAPQRYQPRTPTADVTGEEREVDEREDVVDAVVVLGDAEGPADLRPFGGRVGVGDLADRLGRDAGELLAARQRVGLDVGGERIEAVRRPFDESWWWRSAAMISPGDGVDQRDVAADIEAEPQVREAGAVGAAGTDAERLRAVAEPGQEVVEEGRVRGAGVRAPEEHHVGLLDLGVGARPSTRTQDGRQTDDRRGVSGAVASVDVVRPEDRPGQLLGGGVHLVGRRRAAEDAERSTAVGVAGRGETRHHLRQGPPPSRPLGAHCRRGRGGP
ncbi:MAG: hypothetical protein AAGF02_02660 [Actinomycetota bacterium]